MRLRAIRKNADEIIFYFSSKIVVYDINMRNVRFVL